MIEHISEEMPYEKFEKYGVNYLSDTELLAILLRTGTKAMPVKALAFQILTHAQSNHTVTHQKTSLLALHELTYEQLKDINGVGHVKAIQILTLLELSKRLATEKRAELVSVKSPQTIAAYFMEELRHIKEERFIIVLLDTKCKMMGYETVSKGSLTAAIVHPREVFKYAIKRTAHSVIALHNHPSGEPTPSEEDKR